MSSKETRQCFLEQQTEGGSKPASAHRLEVAHLHWDKGCHQSRAARLPGAVAAQRLSQHAVQNRAYHLIISALSHKEQLGDGCPIYTALLQSPAATALVPAQCQCPGTAMAPWSSASSRGGGEQQLPTACTSTPHEACLEQRLPGWTFASEGGEDVCMGLGQCLMNLWPPSLQPLACPEGCERFHTTKV